MKTIKITPSKTTKRDLARSKLGFAVTSAIIGMSGIFSYANASLILEETPLYSKSASSPLVMLVVGRDHTLFSEAYDDTINLEEGINETINNRFTKDYKYTGYFDNTTCYLHDGAKFYRYESESAGRCTNAWHGNFLNYHTMTRMDLLRKTLYGGHRSTDTSSETVLERAFIPADGHGWAKSYHRANEGGPDTYNISHFAPLNDTFKYLFANATFSPDTQLPILRYIRVKKKTEPWHWASENPMLQLKTFSDEEKEKLEDFHASLKGALGLNTDNKTVNDLIVRVKVCDNEVPEPDCTKYDSNHKPTGLLHQFSEEKDYHFGLLTGTYEKNLSGGVIRQAVASFLDEVNEKDGTFKVYTDKDAANGIVGSIDKIQITGFDLTDVGRGYGNWDRNDDASGDIKNRAGAHASIQGECKHTKYKHKALDEDGECTAWGNPIGEMLFESLRYFSGETAPTAAYQPDKDFLGLTKLKEWKDPFTGEQACSQAVNLIISDINPSYDSNGLPGAPFNESYTGSLNETLKTFNAKALLKTITGNEPDINTDVDTFFIGDSIGKNSVKDDSKGRLKGSPTPKSITDLSTIRGLPAEPSKEGSYTSAAVAYFGQTENVTNSKDEKNQNITTLAVAMSPPLPIIEIKMGADRSGSIKIVPFAKFVSQTIGDSDIEHFGIPFDYKGEPTKDRKANPYVGTSGIVDYYIDNPTDVSDDCDGCDNITKYRVNFEEVEYGSDYDMDMIVTYTVTRVSDSKITVEVEANNTHGGGGIVHAGYIISGIDNGDDKNNVFLDVRSFDERDRDNKSARAAYFLDTPYHDSKSRRGLINDHIVEKADKDYSTAYHDFSADDKKKMQLTGDARIREFEYSAEDNAKQLKSPLWYASKYGHKNGTSETGWYKEIETASGEKIKSPKNYFPVQDASKLSSQIEAALNFPKKKMTSSAPVFNATTLVEGSFFYQNTYENQFWTGNVSAYSAAGGNIDTSAASWDVASELLDDLLLISDINADGNRNIYTRSSEGGIAFEFTSTDSTLTALSTEQKAYLSGLPTDTIDFSAVDDKLKQVIRYLRGNPLMTGLNLNEDNAQDSDDYKVPAGFRFKDRYNGATALGAVINSTPYYIGPVGKHFGHNVARKALAFGANDGMVHIVSAEDGEEILAYMPSTVYGKGSGADQRGLHESTQEDWQYLPTVDGGITGYTSETETETVDGKEIFKTTIVGSLGLHFKGLYAIDVTNLTSGNVSHHDILWEITPNTTGFENIGVTKQAPQVAKINYGTEVKEVVIFSNGYNSVGNGMLYLANLSDGSYLDTLDTGTPGLPSGESNPLSRPALIDLDFDGIIDKIYVGDSLGNLWAFSEHGGIWSLAPDITDSDLNTSPIFRAQSPSKDDGSPAAYYSQPITAQPQVTRHPGGVGHGLLITFGTGRYAVVGDHDPSGQNTQSLYVIHDDSENHQSAHLNITRSGTENKYTAPVIPTAPEDPLDPSTGVDAVLGLTQLSINDAARTFTTPTSVWNSSNRGIYVDLIVPGKTNEGERVISSSLITDSGVTFASITPKSEETCGLGAYTWFTTINFANGKVPFVRKEDGMHEIGGTIYNPGDDSGHDDDDEKVKIIASGVEEVEGASPEPKKLDTPTKEEGKLNWRELLF